MARTHTSPQAIVSGHEQAHGSVASYSVGFMLSIVLTLLAYGIVVGDWLNGTAAMLTLGGLALVQLLVQLLLFLHLGRETKPRWNLLIFLFMFTVVLIIVGGSLWIMHNLNYHMMPAHDMDQHMLHESQKGF